MVAHAARTEQLALWANGPVWVIAIVSSSRRGCGHLLCRGSFASRDGKVVSRAPQLVKMSEQDRAGVCVGRRHFVRAYRDVATLSVVVVDYFGAELVVVVVVARKALAHVVERVEAKDAKLVLVVIAELVLGVVSMVGDSLRKAAVSLPLTASA